jgi:hypothetical protein
MYELMIWATIAVCAVSAIVAYISTRDVFHPVLLLAALCIFIYGYMPLSLQQGGLLFTFVTEAQAEFCQMIALFGILAMMIGCFVGSKKITPDRGEYMFEYSGEILQRGGYILGALGLACWGITIHGVGGFAAAFGQADGQGWSEYGYIREGVYLLIVAIILLLTPQAFKIRDRKWYAAVIIFSIPFVMQGLLGARRGPTFVITGALGMSWYLARGKRPPLPILMGAAALVGTLMLFLVTNREKIYLGSDFNGLRTDITGIVTRASESNEYVFGVGCIENARVTNRYFWGRRYFAYVFVRPIPHQIWPDKYADFGVIELTRNAGASGMGLAAVMGWKAVPGAAAAMIADMWVEFSWLMIPALYFVGYGYGMTWKRMVDIGGVWNSQYTIISILAIYLVTQSGEAVIFRFFILTIPAQWVWRKAKYLAQTEYEEYPAYVS